MRQDVMVYYNDQIMDNLIRAKNDLPFVHVDITLLVSSGASQITGTIGGGETRSSTTNPGVMGALSTISRAVTRPFAYSVSPQQTESLSISAAPALGSQALVLAPSTDEMEVTKRTEVGKQISTEKTPAPSPSPQEMIITKQTEVGEQITTEKTPKKPKIITLYELYENFAKGTKTCRAHLTDKPIEPKSGTYLPGTLKRWNNHYYYIASEDKRDYYVLCRRLFTKGQAGSVEKQLQVIQAEAATSSLR